jgi:hypothetical protein
MVLMHHIIHSVSGGESPLGVDRPPEALYGGCVWLSLHPPTHQEAKQIPIVQAQARESYIRYFV